MCVHTARSAYTNCIHCDELFFRLAKEIKSMDGFVAVLDKMKETERAHFTETTSHSRKNKAHIKYLYVAMKTDLNANIFFSLSLTLGITVIASYTLETTSCDWMPKLFSAQERKYLLIESK